MNRRQKIIISVTGIFLVLLILVGLTYAYFLTQIQGNEEEKSIIVTTANLVLEYQDGNGIIETDKLEPSNDFIQFKDSEGNSVPSKIFTVTNKGNATVEGYKVYLEKVQNQLERKDDLVYTLSCKAYTNYGETNQAESGTCAGVGTETTFPDVITSIVSNDINVGVTHVYELKAKYKEMGVDQSVDMNKLITAKINIYDSTTKFLAREIIDNSQSTQTVDYNKSTYINPSLQDGITYTIPAEQINGETERILTYTYDDLGTSYYFRGNVEDNYVNFAGMCWRIVRIDGSGNIKLILEDQYTICNDDKTSESDTLKYTGAWDIVASDGISITMNGTSQYRTGNFGTESGRISYLNPVNKVDRAMINAFQYFQTNTLNNKINDIYIDKTINNYLVSRNWCLNNKTHNDNAENILPSDPNFSSILYYDSYVRLIEKQKKEPTLKCSVETFYKFDDNKDGIISENETDMYVGTLTADEISFAGGKADENNLNYYLINNWQTSNSKDFWTLSAAYLQTLPTSYDFAFVVLKDGKFSAERAYYSAPPVSDSGNYSFRPSILLNSRSVISGGEGTIGNPYIVE